MPTIQLLSLHGRKGWLHVILYICMYMSMRINGDKRITSVSTYRYVNVTKVRFNYSQTKETNQ